VWLDDGTTLIASGLRGSTIIRSDISEDGEQHFNENILQDFIPKTLPYDLALRISKDGNMPQLRFNEDGQWHDFFPEGGTGLKAGPWFPCLVLSPGHRLSNHRVDRPRPVKGAGMNKSLAPSAAPASNDAGAASSDSSHCLEDLTTLPELPPAHPAGYASAVLDPAGWKCNKGGKVKNREPRCKEGEKNAAFKHSQSLEAEDVWRMKVGGGCAVVGIAAEGYR
jgi:hypothetical protein